VRGDVPFKLCTDRHSTRFLHPVDRSDEVSPRRALCAAYKRIYTSGGIGGVAAWMARAIMALGMQKREARGDVEA